MRRRHRHARSLLLGALSLMLSLVLFFQISRQLYRTHEVEVELVVTARELFAEQCEALEEENVLFLDGRFPLALSRTFSSPSLLRFYDSERGSEFTVPSVRYSDYELTLHATGREHAFGVAIAGVRTVNVGMSLTLYGANCKIYGTVSELSVQKAQ